MDLSASVRTAAEAFAFSLEEELGDRLQHVLVFGSATRGHWRSGHSDVNLLVVVDHVDRAVLDAVRTCKLLASTGVVVRPRVVTQVEIHGSADVFPIETADMDRHHVVIFGEGPKIPDVAKSHLRLRVEQQFRAIAGKLRGVYIADRDKPERLLTELSRVTASLFLALEAWIYLENGEWPDDQDVIMRVGGEFAGVDAQVFERLRRLDLEPELVLPRFEELIEAVDRLVEQVDGKEIW